VRVIFARNVHEVLPIALRLMADEGVEGPSRNGRVVRLPLPLTTAYLKPCERVLLWRQRDANPFFHFFESLWMLDGRNDVAFMDEFTKGLHQFSDDGQVFNGAYGYRWRRHFGVDQLRIVIDRLRADRNDRRCVIQMWDARHDLGLDSKDLPCNTQAYPQISVDGALDLMVTNRSNDLVWGAYGANAVHFSVLLEYLALAIGVPVGVYYQTSFNAHLYVDRHKDLLMDLSQPAYQMSVNPYEDEFVHPIPLMQIPVNRWNRELASLLQIGPDCAELTDPFLEGTARPLWRAWRAFKEGGPDRVERGQQQLLAVAAPDWRRAAWEFLDRRRKDPS
jgi:thymidylate synthase